MFFLRIHHQQTTKTLFTRHSTITVHITDSFRSIAQATISQHSDQSSTFTSQQHRQPNEVPSVSSSTVSTNKTDFTNNQPMSILERIRQFPAGMFALRQDYGLYKNISDAQQTPRNAWKHRIPRREQEQQRQITQDMTVVLPLVLLWLPPIISYAAVLLAVMAPRQVLSRQFWNDYEQMEYASIEWKQRKAMYRTALADWTVRASTRKQFAVLNRPRDMAGPVLDSTVLSALLLEHEQWSLKLLSRTQLRNLALAVGVHQRLPLSWTSFSTAIAPRSYLEYRIRVRARHVAKDDELLLEEDYLETECADLTDQELVAACLLRGLPLTSNKDMRVCLVNHLTMIKSIESRNSSEEFGVFALFLTILRDDLKSKYTF